MSHPDPKISAEIEAAYAERKAQTEWWERDDDPAVTSYKADYYKTHPASVQRWAAAEASAEEGRAR